MSWKKIEEPLFEEELPANGELCFLGDNISGIVTMGFMQQDGSFVMMGLTHEFEADTEPTHFMSIPPLPSD